jgi:hypothetical protein
LYHFKLLDRQVKVFAPGTASSLMWIICDPVLCSIQCSHACMVHVWALDSSLQLCECKRWMKNDLG